MDSVYHTDQTESSNTPKFSHRKNLIHVLNSPSLDLSFNLQVLSTESNKSESHIYRDSCYARRKLSLTFNDSASKVLHPDYRKQVSMDDGCYIDTPPCSQESPTNYNLKNIERSMSPFLCTRTSNFRKNLSEPMVRCPHSAISAKLFSGADSDPSSDKENVVCGVLRTHKYVSSVSLDNTSTFKSPTTPHSKRVAFSNETNRSFQSPRKNIPRRPTCNFSRAVSTDDGFIEQYTYDASNSPFIASPIMRESSAVIPNRFDKLLYSPLIESPDNRLSSCDEMSCAGNPNVIVSTKSYIRPARFHAKSMLASDNITRRLCWSESVRDNAENHPQTKRRKSVDIEKIETCEQFVNQPINHLYKCHSEAELRVKSILNWEELQQDHQLIGDFSKKICLPIVNGRHQDLKCISIKTMANLLNDSYSDVVSEFTIIDCRYPYEYDGGHIKGAKNIYTIDAIKKDFFDHLHPNTPSLNDADSSSNEDCKRTLYIFHCEFSSERAPKMSRFLRNKDRDSNADLYPKLHYPELYLLEGGYKAFFEAYPQLCEPQAYIPMLHRAHNADLKLYRAKSSLSVCSNRSRLNFASRSYKGNFE